LLEFQKRGTPLFLRTDSHWTPEAMRMSALYLTVFLAKAGLTPEGEHEGFHAATSSITNAGDLTNLIGSEGVQEWQETITVHPVGIPGNRAEDPRRWRPDPDSPLLLLGDSFTNVFSLPEMGWGEDAGFAEGLSQSLGFVVDRIARNADGAFASRQELQREAGRLRGKRVVVWQFAARELSFGDWKVLPLPPEGIGERDALGAEEANEVEGVIARVAPVPDLRRTPYREAVMEVSLQVDSVPGDVVLLGLGVEERLATPMTAWKVGQRVRVKTVPWRAVEERYGRLHRFALEDPEFALIGVERFWIVKEL
jgi:alginate O-acetyltransferase complex protein AlgJ